MEHQINKSFSCPQSIPGLCRKRHCFLGRRPELVGGGLIRSAGGWSAIKAMRRVQDHMKSDERILGDGDFTQSVLDEATERLEERYWLQAQGYDLEKITIRVSSELGIDPEQVCRFGRPANSRPQSKRLV